MEREAKEETGLGFWEERERGPRSTSGYWNLDDEMSVDVLARNSRFQVFLFPSRIPFFF